VRNFFLLLSAKSGSYDGAPKSISGAFPDGMKSISGGVYSGGAGPLAVSTSFL